MAPVTAILTLTSSAEGRSPALALTSLGRYESRGPALVPAPPTVSVARAAPSVRRSHLSPHDRPRAVPFPCGGRAVGGRCWHPRGRRRMRACEGRATRYGGGPLPFAHPFGSRPVHRPPVGLRSKESTRLSRPERSRCRRDARCDTARGQCLSRTSARHTSGGPTPPRLTCPPREGHRPEAGRSRRREPTERRVRRCRRNAAPSTPHGCPSE